MAVNSFNSSTIICKMTGKTESDHILEPAGTRCMYLRQYRSYISSHARNDSI